MSSRRKGSVRRTPAIPPARTNRSGAAERRAEKPPVISVVMADDHVMLRDCLRRRIEETGVVRVLAEASTAKELLKVLSKVRPDIVLLDLKLPDAQGFELIRRLKKAHPECRIVVLTMYELARYALQALESGADGYVIKDAPFEELLQALRTVRAGGTYACSRIARELMDRLPRSTQRRSGSLDSLSRREFETLSLLGSGLTLKQASMRMGVSQKTASTYQTRLKAKLHLSNHADLVKVAMDAGLAD